MKILLSIFALLAAALAVAQPAEKPIDLTGADANQLKSQVGHTVTLCGRLEDGKQGLLLGAKNVGVYVLSERPPGGDYSYPKTWTRFMHQQVRITGELRFRSFDHSNARDKEGRAVQVPPDYFYMVLQLTKIERVEPK
ncbi:MAG TPA: hypothetical protein VFF39_01625 [Verrucomicrobiae bacterium]|nr:hypothetical protein [Verrucomicrobiae bacterium]